MLVFWMPEEPLHLGQMRPNTVRVREDVKVDAVGASDLEGQRTKEYGLRSNATFLQLPNDRIGCFAGAWVVGLYLDVVVVREGLQEAFFFLSEPRHRYVLQLLTLLS